MIKYQAQGAMVYKVDRQQVLKKHVLGKSDLGVRIAEFSHKSQKCIFKYDPSKGQLDERKPKNNLIELE